MGKKLKTKAAVFVFLFGLIAPAAGWALDSDTTAPVTTTTAANPAPRKSHRRKKKATSDPAVHASTAAAASATDSHAASPVNNSVVNGITDGLGPNNPGSPNMGSQDHVPGTTGTSGQ